MLEDAVHKFVEQQRSLLELEYAEQLSTQAEYLTKLSKQQLQQRGVALLNLRESSRATGLGGKLIIEYVGGFENALPAHQLKSGDVVKVEKGAVKSSAEVSGIVYSAKAASISVAFKDDYPENWKDGLRMIKLANDVSFKRMRYALHKLEELPKLGSHNRLLQVVFDKNFTLPPASTSEGLHNNWFNKNLNEIQMKAIQTTLGRDPVALIHGPPGTGKTETLVEIIKQLVKPGASGLKSKRVLVCAPSNLAVDNLVERLAKDPRFPLVRLGHPARMLDSVVHHSLDYILVNGEHGGLVRDIRKDIDGLVRQIDKAKGQSKREIYGQLKELRRDIKLRETKALDEIFRATPIVLCTLNMAGSKLLDKQHFDVAIIDEASQALEAECWLPIIHADRVIFAGDHQQLPPTVTSEEAARKGLSETLFGKLINSRELSISCMLQIQYRMHESIMQWASDAMYEGKLIAHESVAKHKLSDIVPVIAIDEPIMMIDTAGCEMSESVTEGNDVESKFNEGEAKIALEHVKNLVESGLKVSDCAIIAPYNGQVDLIKSMIESENTLHGLEIGTVDSFQGREKEAIVISFVRSNDEGEIGFLSEVRRTNVAVTRARRHVYLIGDSDTLCRHPFYKTLIKYVEEHGLMDYAPSM